VHSIRVKTSAFIILLLAGCLTLVVAAAAWYVHTTTRTLLLDQIDRDTRLFADLVGAEIGRAQATANALAAVAEAQIETGRTDREGLRTALRTALEKEPGLFGTWIVFQPDGYDARDRSFAGTIGHDRNGMINYYYLRKGSAVELNPYDAATDQSEQLQRDWYRVPASENREAVIEPYLETFDGAQGDHTVMMTSATSPVRVDGLPVGVAGVDLTLEGLQLLVAPIAVAGTGTAAIISPHGTILAHPESRLLGTDALEAGYSFRLLLAVGDGQPFRETVATAHGPHIVTAVPISFGNSGETWTFVFQMPMSSLEAMGHSLVRKLTVLGVVLLALAGAVGAWAGSALARPIQEMTRAMRALAADRLDTEIPRAGSRDEIGEMAMAMATFRDNAVERRRLEASMVDLQIHTAAIERLNGELRQRNDRFDAALSNMSQGLCMLDAGLNVIVVNERFLRLYALEPSDAAPGTPLEALIARCCERGGWPDDERARRIGRSRLRAEERLPSVFLDRLPDGRILEVRCEPMRDGGWVNTVEDVTLRSAAEARIAHLARHDSLTDLANRTLFRERLDEALADEAGFALLVIDLDRFKPVNDTLGHHIGDLLLRAVGERLTAILGDGGLVARFGGDEFGLIALGASPAAAADIASRIAESVAAPFTVEGHQIGIGASIGLTVARSGSSADTLLKEADLALYRVKSEGRGTYCFFEPAMDAIVRERRALEIDLRRAIDEGALTLHYQPIVDVGTGMAVACEALLRWDHPERGSVSPSQFVSVAEESGLIGSLGRWVIRQACRDACRWPDDVKVAVNLSPAQFYGTDVPAIVAEALAETGLPGSRLELEITESVLLKNSDGVLETLSQLRDLGVSIVMDDFGTGYSSLGYLRRFPFEKLKIDRSFVGDLARSGEARAIVAAIIGLGASLGMGVTAEGVETEEQLMLLRSAGCREVQGFLVGRPAPAGALSFATPSAGRIDRRISS
jgi:diguanylate cyclase (GGDEF)-like protein